MNTNDSWTDPRSLRDTRATTLARRWRVAVVVCSLALFSHGVPIGIAEESDSPGRVATEPESAGPGFRTGSEADQVELLRRLLGVEEPEQIPVEVPDDEPSPLIETIVEPEPAAEPATPVKTPARSTPKAKPAPRPKPVSKPVAKPAPKPSKPSPAKDAPMPVSVPDPEPAPEPMPEAAALPEKAPAHILPTVYGRASLDDSAPASADDAEGILTVTETDLPATGTIIDARNIERWSHVLTPSLRWALHRGARMEVADAKPIVMEPWRIEATEKYHSQVRLGADRKSMVNYVAGIPFPFVTETDPDAAIKLMFNYESRVIIDDLEGRNFGCETGGIDIDRGLNVERAGRFGALRRLHYTGRLRIDPKPTWKTTENIRYRESLFPVIEPFNNKGAGFSYARYLDSGRQDDAWLYLPATRRVRRLSTAQRSEGIFGVDIDLDSYGGFAGNPAWFEWRLLGRKTLLAPLHAKNEPVKWCDKPADFMFDDIWEPRDMYILSARSLIPGYNFSLRVLYIDAQAMAIPYTEVYDHDGQLWRAYVQQFKSGVYKSMKYSTVSVYPVPMPFITAITVFDMQLEHTSRCQFPAAEATTEEGWYYWFGDKGGTSEDDFDVKNFLQAGR